MNEHPFHITVNVPAEDWGKPEGLITLCGSESEKIIRFQFFDNFLKVHMVNESDVCKECLEILRLEEFNVSEG